MIVTSGEVLVATLAPGRLVSVAVCAIVGLLALVRLRRRVIGTTRVAPWWWCCGSLLVLCLVEGWLSCQPSAAWHSHLRYAAATTTLWPLVALLGAKRPQDRAWQLIVLSLWVVVLLPAGEAFLYAPQTPFELTGAWQLFVLSLVLVGLANGLPTRGWTSAVALFAGRLLLFAPNLAWGRSLTARLSLDTSLLGLVLIVAAIVIAAILPGRRRPAHSIDCVWLDFRDAYGLLWGLRVAERFNAAARQLKWGIHLRWRGLDADEGCKRAELTPEILAAARQNLEMLLRRFVSPEWFASRWDDGLD